MSRRNRRAMRRFDREHFCWLEDGAYTFVGPAGAGQVPATLTSADWPERSRGEATWGRIIARADAMKFKEQSND